jgi:putative transposase
MNELRTRGVSDILIAVVDGLNGFPDAINAVFPQTQVQTCIVHLLRHALSFASWKDRRELVAALKPIGMARARISRARATSAATYRRNHQAMALVAVRAADAGHAASLIPRPG